MATFLQTFGQVVTDMGALYDSLHATYDIKQDTGVATKYMVALSSADGNRQGGLLTAGGKAQAKADLARLAADGYTAVEILVAWPLLDDQLSIAQGGIGATQAQAYQAFYLDIVNYARNTLGFFVAMSTGVGVAVNYTNFKTAGGNVETLQTGRMRQARWMMTNLNPDWLTSSGEVSSFINVLDGPSPTSPHIKGPAGQDLKTYCTAAWWTDATNQAVIVRDSIPGCTTMVFGGAMPSDGNDKSTPPVAYWQALTNQVPGITCNADGFDQHVFPMNGPAGFRLIDTFITRAKAARANGFLISNTQTSLWPMVVAESTNPNFGLNVAYGRECWKEFEPLFVRYVGVWDLICRKIGVNGIVYFWGLREFYGNRPNYDGTTEVGGLTNKTQYDAAVAAYQTLENNTTTGVDPSYRANILGGVALAIIDPGGPGQAWAALARGSTDTPTPPTLTFTSDTTTIVNSGDPVHLSWTVSGTAPITLSLNHQIGDVTGTTTLTVNPPIPVPGGTYTYILTATGSAVVQKTIVITRSGTTNVAPTATLTATPATITTNGQAVTLAWTATGTPAPTLTLAPVGGDVTGRTSLVVNPGSTTTYTLTADNGIQPPAVVSATVTLQPIVLPPTISPLTATPSTPLTRGDQVVLSWVLGGDPPTYMQLDPFGGILSGLLQWTDTPLTTTTYTLHASNTGGIAIPRSITVIVNNVHPERTPVVARSVLVERPSPISRSAIVPRPR